MLRQEFVQEITFVAYDTLCQICIMPYTESEAISILQDARGTAHLVEKTLNMFDENSELSILCKNYEVSVPCRISEMLYSFIEINLQIAALSNGKFDFTMGKLIKLWNFLSEDPKAPEKKEINNLRQSIGYQHVSLIPEQKSVVFKRKNMQLDPGASGKGFALEKVAQCLRNHYVKNAVLDFGGNIFVIGGKWDSSGPTANPWITALRNPINPQTIIGGVPLIDAGIATSSWYEHCFQKDNTIYHHLLNPITGYPLPLDLKSVSIISSSALHTDILSTAFFVLGFEKGKQLVEELRSANNISIEYVAVRDDLNIVSSPGAGYFSNI